MVQKQDTMENIHALSGRAAGELRRQMGLILLTKDAPCAVFPAEFLTDSRLASLTSPRLLITGARARSLGIETSEPHALLDVAGLSAADIAALADPTLPQISPPQTLTEKGDYFSLLLMLAKRASLLPALLLSASRPVSNWLEFGQEELSLALNTPEPEVVETARARLPLAAAEHTVIACFRTPQASSVHLALLIGDVSAEKTPLVRLHSSCVTGDILGSLRCDCGDQLQLAIAEMARAGGGILIYLHQEGRGIGLTNKLRAYRLQEMGVDTYEANLMLGFDEDERDFRIAASILKKLGVSHIRLLTNNPRKIENLERHGIRVQERAPLIAPRSSHNQDYMDAKGKKAGHIF